MKPPHLQHRIVLLRQQDGFIVQATCDANYRFCSVSIIAPAAAKDWSAWTRSSLAKVTMCLPDGDHIMGDAAFEVFEDVCGSLRSVEGSLVELTIVG